MSDLFKKANLQQRVITGVIAAAVLLAVVVWTPFFYFQLAMLLVFVVAAWEWANLAGFIKFWQRLVYVLLILLLVFLLQLFVQLVFLPLPFLAEPGFLYLVAMEWLMAIAVVFWSFAFLLITTYPRGAGLFNSRIVRAALGCLALIPTWAGVVFLKQQHEAGGLVLLVVAMIACADIGAYFAGVRFGKHKLAPSVSPGKTWEGVAGALLANIVLGLALAWYWHMSFAELLAFAEVAALVVAFSIIGDLFESMIKRCRGVKDSGTILPGHGGVLDRIDGWMAAVPVFTLSYLVLAA